jgi:hypothetical protein
VASPLDRVIIPSHDARRQVASRLRATHGVRPDCGRPNARQKCRGLYESDEGGDMRLDVVGGLAIAATVDVVGGASRPGPSDWVLDPTSAAAYSLAGLNVDATAGIPPGSETSVSTTPRDRFDLSRSPFDGGAGMFKTADEHLALTERLCAAILRAGHAAANVGADVARRHGHQSTGLVVRTSRQVGREFQVRFSRHDRCVERQKIWR